MDKRLILLGLLFLASHYLIAQEDATQAINEIKRQSDIYLYSESTSQSWEEALDNAKYLLGVEIETWVKTLDSKPADGYIAEAQNTYYNRIYHRIGEIIEVGKKSKRKSEKLTSMNH